jgi:hypothetical protein
MPPKLNLAWLLANCISIMALGVAGVRQQALQLDHGLARQDHFLLGHFDIQRGAGKGQAVAVGGHQAQLLAFGHKQDAVEVVADVVHRHRKRHLVQQVFERLLRHAEARAEVGGFLHQRKVFGRQRLQRELALAALEDQLGLRWIPGSPSGRPAWCAGCRSACARPPWW